MSAIGIWNTIKRFTSLPLSEPRSNTGVLYLAVGPHCRKEALISARSLKASNPRLPATLITDEAAEIVPGIFDSVLITESRANPFRIKVDCLLDSPFETTLFLDTDILVRQSLIELFDRFEGFDFGICREPYKTRSRPPDLVDYEHPYQMNSGVFLYRKTEAFKAFWQTWKKKTETIRDEQMRPNGPATDQGPCNLALAEADLDTFRLLILPSPVYNARLISWPRLMREGRFGEVKIMHGRGAAEFLAQHRARIS